MQTSGIRCSMASPNSDPIARPIRTDMNRRYFDEVLSPANDANTIPGRAAKQIMNTARVP